MMIDQNGVTLSTQYEFEIQLESTHCMINAIFHSPEIQNRAPFHKS